MATDSNLVLDEETTAGNYFVSNYPPYSFWSEANVADAHAALDRAPAPDTPLGVYLHIPFCRKRCTFCYFKVYTDKNASEIEGYLDAAMKELEIYSKKAFIGGRKPKFIYFGGGTPSYISSKQLTATVDAMKRLLPWDEVEEVAFGDAGQDGGIGDLVAVEVEDGQDSAVGFGIEKFVGVPRGGQRPGFGFAVADDASND